MAVSESILVVGASARSAARSAVSAGWATAAIDLFGDLDLGTYCHSQTVGSLQIASFDKIHLAELPINLVITGGMEIKPELLRWLCRTKQLIGTSIDSIEITNDVFLLRSVCQEIGVRFPDIATAADSTPWKYPTLVKPYYSTGGTKIRKWHEGETRLNNDFYLQRFVAGESMSSLFCSTSDMATLIGTTFQLTGAAVSHRNNFCYCGSVGPVRLDRKLTQQIKHAGEQLAKRFRLKGLFGLDWIRDNNNDFWLIEINPRWTASCEIFERCGIYPNLFTAHWNACQASQAPELSAANQVVGKLIVFNPTERIRIDEEFVHRTKSENQNAPFCKFADIPQIGTVIEPNAPILTIFDRGTSVADIRTKLFQRSAALLGQTKKLIWDDR